MSLLDWLLSPKAAAYIVVRGRVYEGSYHFFAERAAKSHNLKGWLRVVHNSMSPYMELTVEGRRKAIERFTEDLRKGPPLSQISKVELEWKDAGERFHDFRVRH
jgi:acylphosphatase